MDFIGFFFYIYTTKTIDQLDKIHKKACDGGRNIEKN